MKNLKLENLALELTKNLINNNKKLKKSTNDYLIEILLNKKLNKLEIINKLSLIRLENNFKNNNKILNLESFKLLETQKLFKNLLITSKNSFEQSYSKGQNNASFYYNKKYKNYNLIRLENYNFIIKEVK